MTTESIRSGNIKSCFPHLTFAGPFSDSQKLKENLLAATFEVDGIDFTLDGAPREDKVMHLAERLFVIDEFNLALADHIVMKVQSWAERCDIPFLSPSEYAKSYPRGDYSTDKGLADWAKQKEWEEHLQIKALAPFCEQLSQKIARVFQRAPLIEFQSQLKPRVEIRSQMPERLNLFWAPARIEEKPVPSVAEAFAAHRARLAELQASETSSSSSSTSSSVSVSEPNDAPKPAITARIAVSYATKPGDRLFIRGTGPSMSWSEGIEMKRKGEKWVFKTRNPFDKSFEYKVVLNDKKYERDANHRIELGQSQEVAKIRF